MLHSIIGWDCVLGAWSRIEGYPCDPNPNDPLARVTSESLFNEKGKLNPSITILGVSLQQFLLFCCSIQWEGFAESNNIAVLDLCLVIVAT